MRIFFVRHGTPTYNPDALTPRGRLEAEETSKFLSTIPFDCVYSSTSTRAIQTAEYTAKKINKNINLLDWAHEVVAGSYYGLCKDNKWDGWTFHKQNFVEKFKELQDDPNWLDDPLIQSTRIPLAQDFYTKNIDEWLKSFNIVHDRKNKKFYSIGTNPEYVALFAHGGFGFAFLSFLMDIPYPKVISTYEHLKTCGIAVFNIDTSANNITLESYNNIFYDEHNEAFNEMSI